MIKHLKHVPIVAAALAFSGSAAAQDQVSIYEVGVNCGALHSFMSAAMEGQDDAASAQFGDSATRFLYLAIVRDQANAEDDMMQSLNDLIDRVESFGEDDASIENLLTAGMERCDAFRQQVAEEYDAIDLSE